LIFEVAAITNQQSEINNQKSIGTAAWLRPEKWLTANLLSSDAAHVRIVDFLLLIFDF
jgi:hypothetical protein